ncbi:MAG: hypothetical protein IPN29_17470 [Saprospiraceae bacterium]|nr:hypothetical protein [Saprospiraceae bacterium]
MSKYLLILIILTTALTGFSQTPQIALVKPNGTTTIHSTLQSAYNASSDDDYIYLPGGTFETSLPVEINKRLHIIGAGVNADSSMVTGITKIHHLKFKEGAAGGSLEGVNIYSQSGNNSLHFGNISSNTEDAAISYTIANCQIFGWVDFYNWENVTLRNNVITNAGVNGFLRNSFITNNIMYWIGGVLGPSIEFSNNILLSINFPNNLPSYCLFKNNIFNLYACVISSNSIFHNNVNLEPNVNENQVFNNLNEIWDSIFINPGSVNNTLSCNMSKPEYLYHDTNNYHLKITSACNNSGTNGTDRGIYGGAFPWKPGSIPSNPHIYHKNVAGSTNANGQLQVHFKVRTN